MAGNDACGSPNGSAAAGADLSELLSVRQAIEVIDQTPVSPRIERLPLAAARGYRLARDVIADRDYPPFSRSVMDGYAVRSADLKVLLPPVANGRRDWRGEKQSAPSVELKVVGEVAAGQVSERVVGPGEAIAIMTGAPVPEGADAVVPIEDVLGAEKTWGVGSGEKTWGVGAEKTWGVGSGGVGGGRIVPGDETAAHSTHPHIPTPHSPLPTSQHPNPLLPTPQIRLTHSIKPGAAIARQGSDCTAGAVVLNRGVEMQAAQIAAAATVGAAEVYVFARPRVAVLSTGDELVPVGEAPGLAQIRNSNNLMLIALLQRMGCEVTNLGTAPDQPKVIRRALEQGMRHDALFVSGGMSMGAYDYVPRILLEMGVELKVTKVRIKPGKPFLFGVMARPAGERGDAGGEEPWGVGSEGVGSVKIVPGDETAAHVPIPRLPTPHGFSPPPLPTPHGFSPPSLPTPLGFSPPTHPDSPRPSVPHPPSAYVFGLPGNPVSAFVCTVRLASRLLARLSGGEPGERWVTGRLEAGLPANGPREFYQPVVRHVPAGGTSAKSELSQIRPLPWKGSADLFTLAAANALLIRGENEPPVPQGTMVRVLEI